ncbi:MAG: ABC transporter permease [Phaeodactylibacter sp.]|nr:ABC transporter permease [Phaeodactylibacter sp.]MCB9275317.1 ABC transporter permease [Lewinellaceae bacterium]
MVKTVANVWAGLKGYRYLVWQLVRANIVGGYKKSFIGLAWMFILPILAVLVWIVLNGAGVVDPGDTGIPYPAYVLLSTSIWGFFLEIYKSSSNALSNEGKLLIMKDFPREVLLAEKTLVHLINFSIPMVLNICVLLLFGVRFGWASLLFPLSLLPLLLLGLGIGMIVSVLRVVAVDICTMIDEGMKLLMFLTPIVYAPKIQAGWLSAFVQWNPLTYLIGFSRGLLTGDGFYHPLAYLLCSLGTALFFLAALAFFRATGKRVLERLVNT